MAHDLCQPDFEGASLDAGRHRGGPVTRNRVAMEGSDAQRGAAAERMRRCRALRAAGIVRVSLELTFAAPTDSDRFAEWEGND
jgi:hypothetical protein